MAGPITLPFVTTFNDKGIKDGQSSLGKLAGSSIITAVSIGGVVDQLGKAVRAAADDQKAQEQLEIAVRNNTTATSLQIGQMERTIGKMETQKAVADDQLRPALGNLVRATGDVTKAQGLLNLALDISAGTGKDLETVSIALAKAQTGNIGALTRLGVPLDAAAVKSKDLGAIQRDLATRFAGASDAAANSADGGMKKLQIALDNTYEAVGYRVLPVLGDYVTVLNDLSGKLLSAETSNNKFFGTLKEMAMNTPVGKFLAGFNFLNKQVDKYATSIDNARGKQYDYSNINQRMNNGLKELTTTTGDNTSKTKSNTDAKKEAVAAAKAEADTLRDRVKTAYETVTEQVKLAQDQYDSFKTSLSDQLRGFVSLSDAIKTQSEAEDNLSSALKDRKDAYSDVAQATKGVDEALKRLIKTEGKDDKEAIVQATEDLAAARLKLKEANDAVAVSETKVTSATKTAADSSYSKAFAKQIEDAKVFGANLQRLVQSGLSQDGLAQLINLGPVAGRQVTQDIIDNVPGMNLGDFVSSLAGLRAAGESLGATGANAFFGAALGGAQAAQGQVANYQITVNAGLISNPAQVGRDIIEAIKNAERVSGQVFVSV